MVFNILHISTAKLVTEEFRFEETRDGFIVYTFQLYPFECNSYAEAVRTIEEKVIFIDPFSDDSDTPIIASWQCYHMDEILPKHEFIVVEVEDGI